MDYREPQVDAPLPEDGFLTSTDTLKASPLVEEVIVLVDGGCVQGVYDSEARMIHYSVIDQDCLEGGQCPTCWEYYELKPKNCKVAVRNWLRKIANKLFKTSLYIYADTYDWCPNCEINWDDPPPIEVQIQKVQERCEF